MSRWWSSRIVVAAVVAGAAGAGGACGGDDGSSPDLPSFEDVATETDGAVADAPRLPVDVTEEFRAAYGYQGRIALADQPENAGQLNIETDAANRAIYFTNPRNTFRAGPAFAAISTAPESISTP